MGSVATASGWLRRRQAGWAGLALLCLPFLSAACGSGGGGAGVGTPCLGSSPCLETCLAFWPGGYCTGLCRDDADCPDGTVCREAGLDAPICLSACRRDRDCRYGYRCSSGGCVPDEAPDGDMVEAGTDSPDGEAGEEPSDGDDDGGGGEEGDLDRTDGDQEALADPDRDPDPEPDPEPDPDEVIDQDADPDPETGRDDDPEREEAPPDGDAGSCGFDYAFRYDLRLTGAAAPSGGRPEGAGPDRIAHAEPAPPVFRTVSTGKDETIVMPEYDDDLPEFGRGLPWHGAERCFELPGRGAAWLGEQAAWELYVRIVEQTLWQAVDPTPGRRTVVGFRGAYPGTFEWHGNLPDRFNDTLVLLWADENGHGRVREFAAHTDTGAHDFGWHASSSLRPNRRYAYVLGWHRGYNALSINEDAYPVRDDTNKNGHWDDDRNGWLVPAGADDHDRDGGAHNIHLASVWAPLETAAVDVWSAGCQTIPGRANWELFIRDAWTGLYDPVDYFLIDARDIDPRVWQACDLDLGTHACPFDIPGLPFEHAGDTAATGLDNRWDRYNCSDADESGPEAVYVLNLTGRGSLTATVETDDEELFDPDVHILWGDDPDACLARGHRQATAEAGPGRYLIVVDTWVDGAGFVMAGPYRLRVAFVPR